MATPEPKRQPRRPRAQRERPPRDRSPRQRSTRARPAKQPLSEAAVLDAALQVLRSEGLDAVTMRRVAVELDTGAASLYVYVEGRDELLRLLFDRVASLVPAEPGDPARWRDQIRKLALDTLHVMEAHPGIARVALAEIPTGDHSMDGAEAMMSALIAGGVEPQRAAWAADAIFLIITANAVETDTLRERTAQTGLTDVEYYEQMPAFFETLPAERYPTLAKHGTEMTTGDTETRFLFSIDTFLDGLVA